ncbi:MAG: phosphoglycerate kinase [Alphaproteobacteria bacterium]|nr:phosphoglycerate kinase [Alphaproteobacteria bacterium]
MTQFRTIDTLEAVGKRVLVRADLNVPMKDGAVTDTARIDQAATTIRELAGKGAKVIVLSHFGRPDGKRVESLSLKAIVPALAKAVGKSVAFANDCIGAEAESAVASMKNGDVLLLENTRFHAEEEKNEPRFVAALAKLGDAYVNDAFSAAHRAHATTEGLAHRLAAYAGRGMQAELEALGRVLEKPEHPVVAIIGGAKVSTKLAVLEHLIEKVDVLVIGGAMANTFLKAQGFAIGKSLHEPALLDKAREVLKAAKSHNCVVVLPSDGVVAKEFKAMAATKTLPVAQTPDDGMILDIGSDTLAAIAGRLETAKTVVWNGPLGAFETPPFDLGTNAVARHVAMLTKVGQMVSVAGGGDTLAALAAAGAEGDFTYCSTAGGAFLEWLEGRELPGVKALAQP